MVNLFMLCKPLCGWREVRVSAQRTQIDQAHCVKELIDVHYPPAEAKRIAAKLEIHATPKHGCRLSVAETELSVLQRQGLDWRLGDRATVEQEVAA